MLDFKNLLIKIADKLKMNWLHFKVDKMKRLYVYDLEEHKRISFNTAVKYVYDSSCDLEDFGFDETEINYFYTMCNKLFDKNNKNDFDNYIVFLLGSDNFEVCNLLRNAMSEWGADGVYEMCIYLAQKFYEYDHTRPYTNKSLYDSFSDFLQEYEDSIKEYINKGIYFTIKEI